MKRILCFILGLVICLGMLSACNQAQPTEPEAPPSPTDTPTDPPTENSGPSAQERGYYLAQDYLADPSLFVPKWQGQFEVPAEMLDWEEKFQQFFTPNGRTMSIGHRGDRNVLYPENSIEAFLSVIYAGIDILEVDVVKTKDNIPIVFHDNDLLRTTNVTLMRLDGKADHLPTSNMVADWTLEQIRELRLVMETGEVTNYVVPTFEDVLMIAKDRVFITLDKFSRFDWNLDIVPIIEKVGAYETVLIPYSYTNENSYGFTTTSFLLKRMLNSGARQVPIACMVTQDNIAQVIANIEQFDFPKAIRCGEYQPNDPAYAAIYLPYAGQYRMFFETLNRDNDNPEVWAQMDEYGFNIIMTNVDPYGLCQFIRDRYFAD